MADLDQLLRDLVIANHIIHYNGVVDAFGHISVRHPSKPGVFIMSANMAPALVRSAADFVEYKIEDSSPVHKDAPRGFIERFIHSELYKRFSDVQCVIHSHAEEVLPYVISGVPLLPVGHMAGFLGEGVPMFDIEESYQDEPSHDMLITSVRLGAELASKFCTAHGSASDSTSTSPDHKLVLMRQHGFTTYGRNIKEAVYRAIYTTKNARTLTTSTLLRNSLDAAAHKSNSAVHPFEVLNARQANDCDVNTGKAADRPWGLWVQEVKSNSLYTNSVEKAQ